MRLLQSGFFRALTMGWCVLAPRKKMLRWCGCRGRLKYRLPLRGDTAHYDVIVNEVTRGIGQSAQETGVPHAFGVLTCDTLEQAIDRAGLKMGNKGFEAAQAAVEMANLKKAVVGRSSLVVGNGQNKGKSNTRKR